MRHTPPRPHGGGCLGARQCSGSAALGSPASLTSSLGHRFVDVESPARAVGSASLSSESTNGPTNASLSQPTAHDISSSDGATDRMTPEELVRVAQFLPRHDLDGFRLVCRLWHVGASLVAPRPLFAAPFRSSSLSPTRYPADAGSALAVSGSPAAAPLTFARWPMPSLQLLAVSAAERRSTCHPALSPHPNAKAPFPWFCLACSSRVNNNTRRCTRCRKPMPEASCRVFVGQLPKVATEPLLEFFIAFLLPHVKPLHVEAHTDPNEPADASPRRKTRGCAWVYCANADDARRLVRALDQRAFFDVDASGDGGVWLLHDSPSRGSGKTLHDFAQIRRRGAAGDVERALLPPLPVKAEPPQGSLLLLANEPSLPVVPRVIVGPAR